MSLIVQKFGGSSLADRDKVLHAAKIIQRTYLAGNDAAVVVSAQGDTTDELLKRAGKLTAAPDVRELDALLATGEQASAALLCLALREIGVPAVSLGAWQLPLLTDKTHGCAKVEAVGTQRLKEEFEKRRVAVVTGFQGVDENGDLTTLGRGGSDLSAVALSAALEADALQIFTDVDGVYTADPRICPKAKHLERVSYREMLTLSRRGAQVLHDRSVALAQKYGVEIEVLSCAEGSGKSIVSAESPQRGIVGIAKKTNEKAKLCAISAVGEALPSAKAERQAIEALESQGITAFAVGEGEDFLTVYVLREEADRALCALHKALVE